MGKLTDLLRQTVNSNVKIEESKPEIIEEKKSDRKPVKAPETEGLEFDITDEELQKVIASVVEIDVNGKTRNEIIIGKYGSIVNPKNGKRFVIPGLAFDDSNYIFNYANMMRTLVKNPEDFKKIMRWE